MTKLTKYILLGLICLLLFPIQSKAKSHISALPIDTQDDLTLIKRLSNNPQLFSSNYLQYFLGPKSSKMVAPRSQSIRSPVPTQRTFWQDRNGDYARYSFEYSAPDPNTFLAEFSIVTTREEDLLLKDISKTLDKEPVYTLDENGFPAQLYVLDSGVKVFAYQDGVLINLAKIALRYAGPTPLPPAKEDMSEAIEFRHNQALEQQRLGHYDKANSLLQSHLQANPTDAEAHLNLAESYKARSCVNEAISEYKKALANCGDNNEIRNRCLEGLHTLKVDLPNNGNTSLINTIAAPISERININPQSQPLSPQEPKIKSFDVGF